MKKYITVLSMIVLFALAGSAKASCGIYDMCNIPSINLNAETPTSTVRGSFTVSLPSRNPVVQVSNPVYFGSTVLIPTDVTRNEATTTQPWTFSVRGYTVTGVGDTEQDVVQSYMQFNYDACIKHVNGFDYNSKREHNRLIKECSLNWPTASTTWDNFIIQ